MTPTAPPAPADRFAGIIDGLCGAVAARGGGAGRLPGPLLILIWTRLRRLAARFAALAARLRAGTLAKPRAPRRRRRAAPPPPQPPPPHPQPQQSLPRNFRWLIRLIPQTAAGASQLRHLLADPEMAALIAAAPQAGKILRPLCRMLGIRPPPGLALPRKPVPAAPPAAAPAAPPPPPPPPPPPRRGRVAKLRAAIGSPGACLPPISA